MKRKMKETKDCRRKTECEWGCWRIIRCKEAKRRATGRGRWTGREDSETDSETDDDRSMRRRC